MDQLKTFLAGLMKYHFWVLCGLALVISLTFWTLATANLNDRFRQRKQKIEQDFQTLRGIQGEADFPNDQVIQALQAKHTALKQKVLEGWTKLYQQQEQNNVWPTVLGKHFIEQIKQLGPNEEIPPDLLEWYQNNIKKHLPTVLEQVSPLQEVGAKNAPAGKPAKPESDAESESKRAREFTGIVAWDRGSQQAIMAGYEWPGRRPASIEVRLAQEDLWVYDALLRIIKETNSTATSNSNAVIRRIDLLRIGQKAAEIWAKEGGSLGKRAAKEGGEEEGSPDAAPENQDADAGPTTEPESPDGEPRPAREDEDSPARKILTGRYLNGRGRPMGPGEKHPFPEFKMMPVHLAVLIHQAEIPRFLALCASSKMPVEVRRLRISGRAVPLDAGRTTDSEGPRRESGHATGEPSEGASDSPASRSLPGEARRSPEYVPLDVLGIIYIYNRPDRKRLGLEDTAERPAAEEPASAPAEPAAEPATEGTQGPRR